MMSLEYVVRDFYEQLFWDPSEVHAARYQCVTVSCHFSYLSLPECSLFILVLVPYHLPSISNTPFYIGVFQDGTWVFEKWMANYLVTLLLDFSFRDVLRPSTPSSINHVYWKLRPHPAIWTSVLFWKCRPNKHFVKPRQKDWFESCNKHLYIQFCLDTQALILLFKPIHSQFKNVILHNTGEGQSFKWKLYLRSKPLKL